MLNALGALGWEPSLHQGTPSRSVYSPGIIPTGIGIEQFGVQIPPQTLSPSLSSMTELLTQTSEKLIHSALFSVWEFL